jgi:predicted AAA+ superfamily ATPase
MMEEVLKRIFIENIRMIGDKDITERSIRIPETDHISILSGIRRCGKTFRLYQECRKYKQEDILFLDFEDERLIQINQLNNYDIILDSYRRLHPERKPVLFFDEIQTLNNWHLFLKRLYSKGYKIYVTGSNANLLSKEIATYLAGCSLETHVYPFSFREYLDLKDIKFSRDDFYGSVPVILNTFDDYMLYGGFPQVINAGTRDKKMVIRTIHEILLYKDLVSKYEKNDYLFQLIISKLVENVGKAFSISRLADKIIPIYKTSKPTVTDYVNLLSMPFIVHNLYQFKRSFVQREMERKIYFQDNSFITSNTIDTDKSRLLENLLFNHLNRLYEEIFYYKTKNNLEVDFLIKNQGNFMAIQVCYSLNDYETRNREIRALKKCSEELGLKHATILTYNEQGSEKINGLRIDIRPVWKYLLKEV